MCLNTGTPKIINFPFGTNGKLMVLGVPIFKHFRVSILEREKTPSYGRINTVDWPNDATKLCHNVEAISWSLIEIPFSF